jgi:hypothetical protein
VLTASLGCLRCAMMNQINVLAATKGAPRWMESALRWLHCA